MTELLLGVACICIAYMTVAALLQSRAKDPEPLSDVEFDKLPTFNRERMERALAGPQFVMPMGLTPEQRMRFITAVAMAAETERERCAKLVETTPAEAFCTVMHQGQLQRARETFAAAIRKGTP